MNYTYFDSDELFTRVNTHGQTTFGYDATKQLTSVIVPPTHPSLQDETFGYDNVGNRFQSTAGASTTPYVPNTLNQYATVDTVTQIHDANGNLTFDGVLPLGWDDPSIGRYVKAGHRGIERGGRAADKHHFKPRF